MICLCFSSCDVQDEIPFLEDHFITLPNGETMHYLDTGNKDGKPILFVHGYPTSAFLYRNIIHRIGSGEDSPYRCIAITHIGFGKSSCPRDGSEVSPLYEVDRIEEFIDLMDLNNFAAVIHDWGGPIGAAATLRHSEKMSHLIILNTMLALPDIPFIESIMGFTAGFLSKPRPVLENIYPGAMKGAMQLLSSTQLSKTVLDIYAQPFEDEDGPCRIHATANLFAKAHIEKDIFEEIEKNAAENWSGKPTLFLWGINDPLLGAITKIGVDAHEEMVRLFPQAETKRIEGANHFMQEDKPEEISDEIMIFIGL